LFVPDELTQNPKVSVRPFRCLSFRRVPDIQRVCNAPTRKCEKNGGVIVFEVLLTGRPKGLIII